MAKAQIRLDRDVAELAKKSAKENSRSLVQEVNHILRALFKKGAAK